MPKPVNTTEFGERLNQYQKRKRRRNPLVEQSRWVYTPEELREVMAEVEADKRYPKRGRDGSFATPGDLADFRSMAVRAAVAESHLAGTDWPGCERLGFKPVRPAVLFHVLKWPNRIFFSVEPLVVCECGNCLSREEALGTPPLPPTPKRIEKLCAEFRAKAWETGEINRANAGPFTVQADRTPGLRSFIYDRRTMTLSQEN